MVFWVVDDESANSVINLGAAHYITRWLVRNTKTKKKNSRTSERRGRRVLLSLPSPQPSQNYRPNCVL